MCGYRDTPAILSLDSASKLLPEDAWQKLAAHGAESLSGTTSQSPYETQLLRKDGSTLTVECTLAVIEWDGELALWASFSDLSDRLQAHAAAEQSRARLQDFAGIASDWFWETDEAFKFTAFHGNQGDKKSASMDALIGHTFSDARMTNDAREQEWKNL